MSQVKKPAIVYVPSNSTQKALAHKWDESKIILLSGPAGVGKTAAGMGESLKRLAAKELSKLYLCRPTITVDEDLGFLPGDVNEKLMPFFGAFCDVMEDMTWDKLEDFNIEVIPCGLLRGRSIKLKEILIIDECQNATYRQLYCACTRLKAGAKLVLIGDAKQSDTRITPNPFTTIISKLIHIEGVNLFQFSKSDQMRDSFTNQIIEALD